MFRSQRVKTYFGVNDFLPGTELERLNSKAPMEFIEQPKLFTKSELRQKAKEAKSE